MKQLPPVLYPIRSAAMPNDHAIYPPTQCVTPLRDGRYMHCISHHLTTSTLLLTSTTTVVGSRSHSHYLLILINTWMSWMTWMTWISGQHLSDVVCGCLMRLFLGEIPVPPQEALALILEPLMEEFLPCRKFARDTLRCTLQR